MAQRNTGIRTCPICGLELGQKNICPVCRDKQDEIQETAGAASHDAPADRLQQYQELKRSLAGNPQDFAFVLQTVRTILRDYADYFHFDYVNFYMEMYRAKCPLAIFAALMDPEWNARYRKILNCKYTLYNYSYISVVFELAMPPLFWSPFLLFEEETYQDFIKNDRSLIASYGGLNHFFGYSSKPFDFEIWRIHYEHLKDRTLRNTDPKRPIKVTNLIGQDYDGWQQLIPAGKRVLILFCGVCVDVKGMDADAAESGDRSDENTVSLKSFEVYDGLQCRQITAPRSDSNDLDYTVLYLVEP